MRRRDALPDPEVERGLRELEAALAGEPTADPDLLLLAEDVDAARPEPSAAFLASLDARVHAGFPREEATPARRSAKPPWHARLRRPTVLAPGAVALLAAIVVAVGLNTASNNDNNDSATFVSASPTTNAKATPMSAEADSSAASPPHPEAVAKSTGSTSAAASPSVRSTPSSIPLPTLAQSRKVQRAAELTLTPSPGDVQDTADGVVRETQAAGGYVQQSNIQTRDDGGTASFTLRIPSAHLDDTLAQLSKLAHVGALNQSATDITAETASAADLLSDARAERQALLKALGRATTDRQIASLKARLRDNRSEIAQRKGALDAQRRRADLATVSVTVEGTGTPKKDDNNGGAWTPRDALHDAGRVLEVAGGVALIALAVLIPIAILALLGYLSTRTLRRHRRETALDQAS